MFRRRTALRESELIKISIHKLVYGSLWENTIGEFDIWLKPERVGDVFILSLFVDGKRQQKFWGLYEAPWGNRKLRNGGGVPYWKEHRYYVVEPVTGIRRQYIYICPRRFLIGTKGEFANFDYDSHCYSKKQ